MDLDAVNITGARILFEYPLTENYVLKITQAQVNSWLVILLLFILCKFLTRNLKVRPESKRQLIAEFIVEKATNLVTENMGQKFKGFTPFITALMALSACSSLLSVFGMYSPTADLNTILGWSVIVFILITYYKMKGGFFKYLKGFTQPIAVLTPFNIISEVATPVSMTFRHFGNICSGTVIMTLVYAALASASALVFRWLPGALANFPFFQVGIPLVLSAYFDMFGGILQAFIYAMLTMLYISSAAEED
ncbi:MAG: F0F1 ATP synthase subunit A [Clostridia bacterium]|nr:F0F1 ATP synthase subunit A [Clostridia bacterium]